jgi:hypothetical protein
MSAFLGLPFALALLGDPTISGAPEAQTAPSRVLIIVPASGDAKPLASVLMQLHRRTCDERRRRGYVDVLKVDEAIIPSEALRQMVPMEANEDLDLVPDRLLTALPARVEGCFGPRAKTSITVLDALIIRVNGVNGSLFNLTMYLVGTADPPGAGTARRRERSANGVHLFGGDDLEEFGACVAQVMWSDDGLAGPECGWQLPKAKLPPTPPSDVVGISLHPGNDRRMETPPEPRQSPPALRKASVVLGLVGTTALVSGVVFAFKVRTTNRALDEERAKEMPSGAAFTKLLADGKTDWFLQKVSFAGAATALTAATICYFASSPAKGDRRLTINIGRSGAALSFRSDL